MKPAVDEAEDIVWRIYDDVVTGAWHCGTCFRFVASHRLSAMSRMESGQHTCPSREKGSESPAVLKLLGLFGDVLANLIAKLGTTLAGVVIIACGMIWILPYFGVPAYVAQGGFIVAIGIGLIAFGKRWAISEAEKRIENPNLPSTSAVPVIQAEIDKLKSNGK